MKFQTQYEEVMKGRYCRLYGEKDCAVWIQKEKKALLAKMLLTVLILSAVICNDVASHRSEYSRVKFDKNGTITAVKRPEAGEGNYSFTTKVTINTEDGPVEKEYYITIEPLDKAGASASDPFEEDISEQEQAEASLKSMISGLNTNTAEDYVQLPEQLETGEEIIWNKADNYDPLLYIAAILASVILLYRTRFASISAAEKKARESVIRELPEFINKLVLLLNAGVVLNTAFLKIADGITEKKCGESYFYRRISDISKLVNETNAAFHTELYSFAKDSGVKELMRITNIMMDNISKGDDMADKLKRENQLLWFARKQLAQEKGRLAETKLTLPLMVLLIVLITVSIAPALLEM